MIFRSIALVLVSTASFSCAAETDAPDPSLPVIPIALMGELVIEAEPITAIGGARREPGHSLHLVKDARFLSAGTVAVAQGSPPSVLLFDSAGTLLKTFGREGDGPGEFKLVRSIHPLGSDRIAVWDVGPQRITLFTGNEAPLTADVRTAADPYGLRESAMYQPHDLYTFGPNRFVLVHLDGARDPRKHEREALFASIVNLKGEYVAHVGSFEGTEWFRGVPLPLGPWSYFATTAGTFYMSDRVSPDLIAYDTSGRGVTRVRLPISREALTQEDRTNVITAFLEGVSTSARASVAEILADAPFPDSTPAITALRSSRDGRLWVRTYSPPGTRTRRWLVVDPAGRTAAAVMLPTNYSVRDATEDRVLLMTSDTLDQETLLVYGYRPADNSRDE